MNRLYYGDSYLQEFQARVIRVEGCVAHLDASAFYPTSGGQPHDLGTLNGVAVIGVEEAEGTVAHTLAAPIEPGPAQGEIDWPRRFDHMQQHTGQHLLSAAFADLFGFQTLSFHMGADVSSIDLECPGLTPAQVETAERRANEIVFENRPVSVTFEDAAAVEGLRKPSDRTGELRIVTIAGLDRSACGGTHVRATGEIGAVQIRKLDKVRGCVRLEFTCGHRTVSRTRQDFNALSAIALSFSAPLDDTPGLARAQIDKLRDAEKARQKLTLELAQLQGKSLYDSTKSGRYVLNGPLTDEARALAQSFTACPNAVFLGLSADPPGFMLAASKDSGVNAGAIVKPLLAELGGRGGGSPQLAQGSLPSVEALQIFKQRITADWPSESI